jgi:hypothetical protein
LNKLIKKLRETGSTERKKGSGRPKSAERDRSIWHCMEQSIIDNAIDEWRKRLRACLRAKGGYLEHLL